MIILGNTQYLPLYVTSSCVGPIPPDVITYVYLLEAFLISFEIFSTSSLMTEICETDTDTDLIQIA